jgi:hypothetical protein
LKGKSTLSNSDGYLLFECKINRLGGTLWTAETCYLAGNGAILSFEFDSDQ